MDRCEEHQMRISSLLDAELDQREYLALLDHVLECSECSQFFKEARSLQTVVEAVTAGGYQPAEHTTEIPAPSDRKRTGRFAWPWEKLSLMPTWGWATAFVVVAVLCVWQVTPHEGTSPVPARLAEASLEGGVDADVTVVLEENRGEMTEDRFVSLAVELLQAEHRYQEKMAEVLRMATTTRAGDLAGTL